MSLPRAAAVARRGDAQEPVTIGAWLRMGAEDLFSVAESALVDARKADQPIKLAEELGV